MPRKLGLDHLKHCRKSGEPVIRESHASQLYRSILFSREKRKSLN